MKINVFSRKLIKPSTPTPQNLSQYKISFTDEFCPPMNVRILLFYSSKSISLSINSNIIPKLEESLAQILPQFYPLAGRFIKQNHMVDCGDQGAEFIEAEAADVESMDLVRNMDADHLNHLLPRQFYQLDESATSALLSIQATRFRCGGVAVGISVSHRICDGSSLETFVQAWSEYTAGGAAAITPSLDSPTLFPRGDLDCTSYMDTSEFMNVKNCAKRFLFTNEAINRLRERHEGISRVRAVCALIAKSLIGVDRARHGRSRPCLVVQAFNIRQRTVPPLPKHTCGNLAVQSVTRTISSAEAESMSFGGLVGVLGEAIDTTTSDCSRILTAGVEGLRELVLAPAMSALEKSASGEVNVIWFSDWSKFGFCRADFGWGKPAWASIGPVDAENMAVLTEREEGGGIEAWVHLKLNEMTYFFEQDEEIRLFTKIV